MNATDKETPDDIEALLPWHAAGTLSRHDRERVEAALAKDPALARRYALVRDEQSETVALNESLGAPPARAMDALFSKIDAEPKRDAATSNAGGSRLGSFLAALSPRAVAYAASGAAIAIVLQAGVIATFVTKQQGGGFITASAPPADASAGAFALIRFAPLATQGDVTKFMQDNQFTIVAGPAASGLYKVRVAPAALPKADLAGIVKRLQDSKIVEFAAATE